MAERAKKRATETRDATTAVSAIVQLMDEPYPLSDFYEDMKKRVRQLDTCGEVRASEMQAVRQTMLDVLERLHLLEERMRGATP